MNTCTTDPELMTPHQRRTELANLLARGFMRARRGKEQRIEILVFPPNASLDSAEEKSVHRAHGRLAEKEKGGQ